MSSSHEGLTDAELDEMTADAQAVDDAPTETPPHYWDEREHRWRPWIIPG